MARLSTQPETAKVVALRSGFYALPLNAGQTHLFVRLHNSASAGEDSDASDVEGAQGAAGSSKQLFVTGLPYGASEKGIKAALNKVWGGEDGAVKVKKVELLPAPPATGSVYTLYQQQLAAASVLGEGSAPAIAPLFDFSDGASTSTAAPAPTSAIVTFSSAPSLPPAPYLASTPLNLPAQPSFLASSAARYAFARPHRSLVTAHVDEWMRAFDARKLAEAPAAYTAPETAAAAKKAKKGKKGKAVADVGPLPGSAAEALARHTALQAQLADRNFNPDEAVEDEWQTVTRGGKHGKSLLPTGVAPTLTGYGGVNVKVAGKKRGRASQEEEPKNDAGIKKIVGEGFYRFNKADSRKKELANLKARFEEDKRRVDRLRGSSALDKRTPPGPCLFTKLPVELLDDIFARIPPRGLGEEKDGDATISVRALLSLSLTCCVLSAPARRALYRRPYAVPTLHRNREKHALLFRTLLAQPILFSYIRSAVELGVNVSRFKASGTWSSSATAAAFDPWLFQQEVGRRAALPYVLEIDVAKAGANRPPSVRPLQFPVIASEYSVGSYTPRLVEFAYGGVSSAWDARDVEDVWDYQDHVVGAAVPSSLFQIFPHLTHLTLQNVRNLSLISLETLSTHSPDLKELDFSTSFWPAFSAADFPLLPFHLTNYATDCPPPADSPGEQHLIAAVARFTHLERLNLGGLPVQKDHHCLCRLSGFCRGRGVRLRYEEFVMRWNDSDWGDWGDSSDTSLESSEMGDSEP
ncbi:hypothetical protein JCM10213_003480 [Rhodosporidiobolus nylandii]